MNRETKGDVIKNGKTKNGECEEDAEALMQEEEKEGDGEEEGLMDSEKEEKGEKEKKEEEEEGLMEGALARYIVTRWSTPCIELVCEFLFLKKTNFILYS